MKLPFRHLLLAGLSSVVLLAFVTSASARVTGIDVTGRSNVVFDISLSRETVGIRLESMTGGTQCLLLIDKITPQGPERALLVRQCDTEMTFDRLDSRYGGTYGWRARIYAGESRYGQFQQRGWISWKTQD